MRCYLVVQERSVAAIRRVVDFLHSEISRYYPDGAQLLTVHESVSEASVVGPATVFYIGEGLAPVTRIPGCTYIFINFSVVTFIGGYRQVSISGMRHIRRKRRLLDQKLEGSDAIFDYYPAQTSELVNTLAKPVFGFLPCGTPPQSPPIAASERQYDVCFVGGISRRRQKVLDAIADAGLKLSPSKGHVLEEVTADSKCTLNVHFQASNHLEIPRIMGSLSTGTPVVTEHSYGLEEVVSSPSIASGRVGELATMAADLIADVPRLDRMGMEAARAYAGYFENAQARLRNAVLAVGGTAPRT